MSTVYERAQEEIRRVQAEIERFEKQLYQLHTFMRVYQDLCPSEIASAAGPQQATVIACRDSDVAEGNSVPAEPESETETERLAKSILADHPGMRIRELLEQMMQLGYAPVGRRPPEVLRTRLLRSRFFQSDGAGVYSLRPEA